MAAPKRAIKPKRKPKYNNVRTKTPDGITHASKKQAARWVHLLELQAQGIIRNLRREVRYPLHVNGVKIGTYIADHQWDWAEDGRFHLEDVKSRSTVTPLYRRSKKHVKAEYGLDIIEFYG